MRPERKGPACCTDPTAPMAEIVQGAPTPKNLARLGVDNISLFL